MVRPAPWDLRDASAGDSRPPFGPGRLAAQALGMDCRSSRLAAQAAGTGQSKTRTPFLGVRHSGGDHDAGETVMHQIQMCSSRDVNS
jgi:hypothetical protein